jgi:hypothetical protein
MMRAGFCWSVSVAGLFFSGIFAQGAVPSGNEVARDLTFAKTASMRKMILDEALGKPHFFRYLQILEMESGVEQGCPIINLTTCEPSSKMFIKFKVVKTISLGKLKEAPESKVGDAIAVTGNIQSVDPVKRVMVVHPVIVRYKDLLARKGGKEMLEERDTSGVVYSFTGGKEPVNVSKRDEDLVQYEGKILAERGKDGWARFLLDEIAKRDKVEKAARAKLDIYKKETVTEDSKVPVQSVITGDED